MSPRPFSRAIPMRLPSPASRGLRGSALFCAVCAGSLLIIGRVHPEAESAIRSKAADTLAPVLSMLSRPMGAVKGGVEWVRETGRLREENAALKMQLARLSETQAKMRELKDENEALRRLLPMAPEAAPHWIAARVVGESGGPFARAALAEAGTRDGVTADEAVIDGQGLVGRVVEAGRTSSRILLITDINSRVPVVGETSGEHAIVSGANDGELRLEYLRPSSRLSPGERLITSGEGGVFPPGIPVASVATITGATGTARPEAATGALSYVSIAQQVF